MIERSLVLPKPATETFFLWGARQTGKSTLLSKLYPQALWIDLLKSEEFRRYLQNPERLREELTEQNGVRFVVVDEVQKVPALLDEIHWLHERRGIRFALCGSSARKVRRGQANLLGGRALRYELHGFSAYELGAQFSLGRMLNRGYLPRVYLSDRADALLEAYVADYLKEEIAAEALARNLPAFSRFLSVASLSDCELVNYSNIARECGVSSQTVKGYFEVLVDTLLGRWLPAYRSRPKRRVIGAPKFYFNDVGVVNTLARRGVLRPGSELYGKAFENWVFHELSTYISYKDRSIQLAYWRLASGIEIDFVIDEMRIAIEAKAVRKVASHHLKSLRTLLDDHPRVGERYLVCLESRAYQTSDGIRVLPVRDFIDRLWQGALVSSQ